MSNPMYSHGDGIPVQGSRAVSANMRNEFDLIQAGFDIAQNYYVDTGTANAIVISPSSSIASLTDGLRFWIKAAASTTGATSVNMGATLGTSIPLKRMDGTALSTDIVAGDLFLCVYKTSTSALHLIGVTKNYVDQLAFNTALPAQLLGLLISNGTAASFSKTFTGFAVNTVRATVASDATNADIWSAAGNEINFTGTATVTNFPAAPVAGAERILHCAAACTFTNNANISVQGAANYTASAGDIITVHAITTTTFRLTIEKADGTPVLALPPRGYINGFGLSNDGTSPNTVLDVAAGSTLDSTNVILINGSAFTKSTAGSWVSGTGANGMGQGLTIANSTWYHVFAIINNGAFDVYFDTSVSAANKPTNTTAYRRIGSFLTNGSAQIIGFYQYGQSIYWNTQVTDLNGTPPSTATLLALTIPSGVNVRPIFSALYQDGSIGNSIQFWSPGSGSTGKNQFALQSTATNTPYFGGCDSILSNTSRQIYYKTNGANAPNVILYTVGWIDPSLASIV